MTFRGILETIRDARRQEKAVTMTNDRAGVMRLDEGNGPQVLAGIRY